MTKTKIYAHDRRVEKDPLDTIWAATITSKDGVENVVMLDYGGLVYPLICTQEDRLDDLIESGRVIAQDLHTRVTITVFQQGAVVLEIDP